MLWVEWVPMNGGEVRDLIIASGFVSVAYLLSVLVMRKRRFGIYSSLPVKRIIMCNTGWFTCI
ncbi:MAG: hypothetical protein CML56_03405 [Rhodobacteraceae bacterium]|nr:hypothetical protein [Paracoccaceae bacterium]